MIVGFWLRERAPKDLVVLRIILKNCVELWVFYLGDNLSMIENKLNSHWFHPFFLLEGQDGFTDSARLFRNYTIMGARLHMEAFWVLNAQYIVFFVFIRLDDGAFGVISSHHRVICCCLVSLFIFLGRVPVWILPVTDRGWVDKTTVDLLTAFWFDLFTVILALFLSKVPI